MAKAKTKEKVKEEVVETTKQAETVEEATPDVPMEITPTEQKAFLSTYVDMANNEVLGRIALPNTLYYAFVPADVLESDAKVTVENGTVTINTIDPSKIAAISVRIDGADTDGEGTYFVDEKSVGYITHYYTSKIEIRSDGNGNAWSLVGYGYVKNKPEFPTTFTIALVSGTDAFLESLSNLREKFKDKVQVSYTIETPDFAQIISEATGSYSFAVKSAFVDTGNTLMLLETGAKGVIGYTLGEGMEQRFLGKYSADYLKAFATILKKMKIPEIRLNFMDKEMPLWIEGEAKYSVGTIHVDMFLAPVIEYDGDPDEYIALAKILE